MPATLLEACPYVGESLGERGHQARGLGVVMQHLVGAARELGQSVPQVVVHVRVRHSRLLGQRERAPVRRHALGEPARPKVRLAEGIVGRRRRRAEGCKVSKRGSGVVGPIGIEVRVAHGLVRERKCRIERQHRCEPVDGLGHPS